MCSRLTAGAALALLIALHVGSLAALIARPPFLDEVESLQAGVRVARGERIYIDFAEHHPPFLFATLARLGPGDGAKSIRNYVIRARIVFAIFGTMAIAAAAAIVWRAAKSVWALVIFIALLFNDPSLWLRAFADVHAEPVALALWWGGLALMLLASSSIARGVGLGLVAHASMWNPKWPVASLAVGIAFLLSERKRRDAIIAAIAVTTAGIGLMAMFADLRVMWGNVFGLTRAMVQWSDRLQAMHLSVTGPAPVPWAWCPTVFLPRFVIPATLVVLVALLRLPNRLISVLVALVAATLIEIRFLYPYPTPWVQYYILYAMVASSMFALVPQAIATLFLRAKATAIAIPVAILAMIPAINIIPLKSAGDSYWQSFAYLHRNLQPADRIWIDLARHPIGAYDAHYYWFGFDSLVPVALQYAPMSEHDLPPCRLERGLEPNLKFLSADYRRLPIVAGCFERLRVAGVVAPSPVPGVYVVNAKRSPISSRRPSKPDG